MPTDPLAEALRAGGHDGLFSVTVTHGTSWEALALFLRLALDAAGYEVAPKGAVAAHEAVLRERGWMDEYESETAAAMNYGDGQHAERARIRAAVEAVSYQSEWAEAREQRRVLAIIEGADHD